jgi:hypothetical protein
MEIGWLGAPSGGLGGGGAVSAPGVAPSGAGRRRSLAVCVPRSRSALSLPITLCLPSESRRDLAAEEAEKSSPGQTGREPPWRPSAEGARGYGRAASKPVRDGKWALKKGGKVSLPRRQMGEGGALAACRGLVRAVPLPCLSGTRLQVRGDLPRLQHGHRAVSVRGAAPRRKVQRTGDREARWPDVLSAASGDEVGPCRRLTENIVGRSARRGWSEIDVGGGRAGRARKRMGASLTADAHSPESLTSRRELSRLEREGIDRANGAARRRSRRQGRRLLQMGGSVDWRWTLPPAPAARSARTTALGRNPRRVRGCRPRFFGAAVARASGHSERAHGLE